MHRTQVYLAQGQYEALNSRARRKGRSLAAEIREAIERYLAAGEGDDPLDRVVGIGKGDGSAVAEHCEEYLYGEGA